MRERVIWYGGTLLSLFLFSIGFCQDAIPVTNPSAIESHWNRPRTPRNYVPDDKFTLQIDAAERYIFPNMKPKRAEFSKRDAEDLPNPYDGPVQIHQKERQNKRKRGHPSPTELDDLTLLSQPNRLLTGAPSSTPSAEHEEILEDTAIERNGQESLILEAPPRLSPHGIEPVASVANYRPPPPPVRREVIMEPRCFYDPEKWAMHARTAMSHAVMFHRKTGGTCEECLKECENYQSGLWVCRSLTYDSNWKICDLFAIKGSISPFYLVDYEGRDYFEYTSASAPSDHELSAVNELEKISRNDAIKCDEKIQSVVQQMKQEMESKANVVHGVSNTGHVQTPAGTYEAIPIKIQLETPPFTPPPNSDIINVTDVVEQHVLESELKRIATSTVGIDADTMLKKKNKTGTKQKETKKANKDYDKISTVALTTSASTSTSVEVSTFVPTTMMQVHETEEAATTSENTQPTTAQSEDDSQEFPEDEDDVTAAYEKLDEIYSAESEAITTDGGTNSSSSHKEALKKYRKHRPSKFLRKVGELDLIRALKAADKFNERVREATTAPPTSTITMTTLTTRTRSRAPLYRTTATEKHRGEKGDHLTLHKMKRVRIERTNETDVNVETEPRKTVRKTFIIDIERQQHRRGERVITTKTEAEKNKANVDMETHRAQQKPEMQRIIVTSQRPLVRSRKVVSVAKNQPHREFSKYRLCSDGEKAIYMVFESTDRPNTGKETQFIDVKTKPECMKTCDEEALFSCSSAVLSNTGCEISTSSADHKVTSSLVASLTNTYMEKICIKEYLVDSKTSTIIGVPNFLLVGFVEEVETASSLQQCVEFCLHSRRRRGYHCLSAMWYPNDPKQNCLLNSESRSTQPQVFTSEDQGIPVIYFEIPTVPMAQLTRATQFLLKDSPLPSKHTFWSNCEVDDEQSRYRYQKCVEKDIRKCPKQVMKCSGGISTVLADGDKDRLKTKKV